MAGLTLVTPPAVEPVLAAEAKLFLKMDVSDDDTLITDLLAGARKRLEDRWSRAFVNQTWDAFFDEFPVDSNYYPLPITLPRAPGFSVTSVKYTTESGSVLTVSSADYYVDVSNTRAPQIVVNVNKAWPSDMLRSRNGVEVRYVAGYGAAAANVPEQLRLAIKQLVALQYVNRDVNVEIPPAIDQLAGEALSGFAYA